MKITTIRTTGGKYLRIVCVRVCAQPNSALVKQKSFTRIEGEKSCRRKTCVKKRALMEHVSTLRCQLAICSVQSVDVIVFSENQAFHWTLKDTKSIFAEESEKKHIQNQTNTFLKNIHRIMFRVFLFTSLAVWCCFLSSCCTNSITMNRIHCAHTLLRMTRIQFTLKLFGGAKFSAFAHSRFDLFHK